MGISEGILDYSAAQLRRLVAGGKLKAVEVAEACLARISSRNPSVNAICTVSDSLLRDARRLDGVIGRGGNPGLLAGLPVGIKDLTDTAGLRTTYGSALYSHHVPDRDAEVVSRLRRAGALIVGKTNTPEFGAGAKTDNRIFGPTRNPWNLNLTAGGSTGGGAAALAAGMLMFAEGTDLGGSLRIPAAFCGVVGLRPTPGLVPTVPSAYAWDTLSVTGGMARTAEDLALLMQAISGLHHLVPFSSPSKDMDFPAAVRRGVPKSTRFGYCSDLAEIGIDSQLEAVCHRCAESLGALARGTQTVHAGLGFAKEAFAVLRGWWMVVQHRSRLERRRELSPNLRANIEFGMKVTTEELARAEWDRAQARRILVKSLEKCHYLLTPCTAVPPFPLDLDHPTEVNGVRMESYFEWFAPTFVLSLTGLPVASVPCGLDERGLPVGLQVVGRPGADAGVLGVCRRVQDLYPLDLPGSFSRPGHDKGAGNGSVQSST